MIYAKLKNKEQNKANAVNDNTTNLSFFIKTPPKHIVSYIRKKGTIKCALNYTTCKFILISLDHSKLS